MWKIASMALALVVSLVLVDSLSAQQGGRGQGQGRRGGFSPIDRVERVKDLNLTDAQKTKLAALEEGVRPEAQGACRRARQGAHARAKEGPRGRHEGGRESGKRGPEVRESIQKAMKLTDSQKTKLADGRKAMEKLNKEIGDKVNKLLTPEQQEVLKKARPQRGNRGRRPAAAAQPAQVN